MEKPKMPMVVFAHTMHSEGGSGTGWQYVHRIIPNRTIIFSSFHDTTKKISWRIGDATARWAERYYGSRWARTLPIWTEARILSRLPRYDRPYPVHFLFGEFLPLKNVEAYHRRGAKVLVTVHASVWRWDKVWARPDGYAQADMVVVTSNSQRVKVEQHVPAERVVRIRQGFRADEWLPAPVREKRGKRLRMFMFGNTDRDHEFAAAVAKKLPRDRFELRVRTGSPVAKIFEDCECVTLLPYLSGEQMHQEYQQADLMFMPMRDSAFNTVLLNAMGCGTPVMVNKIGGVPEYVDARCNFVMTDDHNVDEWVEKLQRVERERDALEAMRPEARKWAEGFDWQNIRQEYFAAYSRVLGEEYFCE